MTPATIIREAQTDGVRMELSQTGTLKVTGDNAAVHRWLAVIRQHKPAIIAHLTGQGDQKPTLTASEETAILAWLAMIGETDQELIDETLDRCRTDPAARAYFLGRARAELPAETTEPDWPGLPDDRRSCSQCRELVNAYCMAARRGELKLPRNHKPRLIDLPDRCPGYAPRPDDSDQRTPAQRWPGLYGRPPPP